MRHSAPEMLSSAGSDDANATWPRAQLAIALLAVDPHGLGGMSVRSHPGPLRDRLLADLRALLPHDAPFLRAPLHVTEDRLLGGLDLSATLQQGRPCVARGILERAHGGVIALAMAERLPSWTAAQIAAALDAGEAMLERDGFTRRTPARFGVIALDEGIDADEQPPAVLLERLAFRVDLTGLTRAEPPAPSVTAQEIASARGRLAAVRVDEEIIEALCSAASALGIDSLRAPILAVRVARAAAALAKRHALTAEDAATAAQLVLAPRATTCAAPEQEERRAASDDEAQRHAATPSAGAQSAEDEKRSELRENAAINDVVLAAAAAVVPAGVLAEFADRSARKLHRAQTGRAGVQMRGMQRGRPAGVRRGAPGRGVRLNILETLRAAAPLQRLRSAENTQSIRSRIKVRPEDFRVTHYRRRSSTTTIFVLDASGSSAMQRLAEAKGAVELLLAECYIRRDSVAVIAFRGKGAEVLLPPTRSLVRARRQLADLPGGGGTPLAAGIEAGRLLADAVARRGCTPTLVILTDGRANVALDGAGGREQAGIDAAQAARRVRAEGVRTVLIDTSPRPQPSSQALAQELGARYTPLPHAEASSLARAVHASPARAS